MMDIGRVLEGETTNESGKSYNQGPSDGQEDPGDQ
jgi:hypothetical protein